MPFLHSLACVLAPVAIVVAGAATAAPAANSALAPVEQHLRSASSMTADFVQTDARNRSLAGRLALKRPGRVRFEYGRGARMLLVANGKSLNFIDYEVGQKSTWPIAKSPLAMLLSDRPDLSRIARLMPSGDPRIVLVRARDSRRPEFGTLVLAFVRSAQAPGGLMLEGWTAIDAQNRRTTVKLANQRYNVALADRTFTFVDPKARGPRG